MECACARVLRIFENFVVAYLELRRTLRYVQRPRDDQPVETTRLARSLRSLAIIDAAINRDQSHKGG